VLLPDEGPSGASASAERVTAGSGSYCTSTRSAASVAFDIVSPTTTAIASLTWRTLPTTRTGWGATKKGEPSRLLNGTHGS
jgi:hypothetical protein